MAVNAPLLATCLICQQISVTIRQQAVRAPVQALVQAPVPQAIATGATHNLLDKISGSAGIPTAVAAPQAQPAPPASTASRGSIYRGVTRASKTSWSAKYSSKRIGSTCKTEVEAARTYDKYIQEHHPGKKNALVIFAAVVTTLRIH
jgi:hypothetical protein